MSVTGIEADLYVPTRKVVRDSIHGISELESVLGDRVVAKMCCYDSLWRHSVRVNSLQHHGSVLIVPLVV